MRNVWVIVGLGILLGSCATSKNYNPGTKFGPQQLQQDYQIFRETLEQSHPSLYWYTPKDSIDYYFNWGASKLTDSMQEYQFRNVLSYVVSKFRCGHTSVRASKAATKFSDRYRSYNFPLSVKAWPDTTIVTGNINRKDSNVTRGVLIKSIEGRPVNIILDSFFKHISADGYNLTHKYQTVSNGGSFRTMYTYFFGLRKRMSIEYIDTAGNLKKGYINAYDPNADTLRPARTTPPRPAAKMPSKKQRKKMMLNAQRSFIIDTSLNTGYMEINAFSKKNKLQKFYKKSFKTIHKKGIENLVIDMRGNGGGTVTLSNLLTKYIADKPFKIADSLYAISNKNKYKKYQSDYLLNRLFFMFLTHKKKDGHYHFSMYENKYFKPKKKKHFDGTTYIVTGGNTFSAAVLFTKSLKDQESVIVVGEETGGGAYGNTAWLIPDMTLPNTKVRFRLPLFRLVIDTNEVKGRGVMPEVEVLPTVDAIRNNIDYKMAKVVELIKEQKDTCVDGFIVWRGNPEVDGLGWGLSIDGKNMDYKMEPPSDEFKVDGLRVHACIYKTQKTFACKCIEPLAIYGVRAIQKR